LDHYAASSGNHDVLSAQHLANPTDISDPGDSWIEAQWIIQHGWLFLSPALGFLWLP
jgi:hypothetical protein